MSDEADIISGVLEAFRRHLERFHKCAACEAHLANLLKAITNWVNRGAGENVKESYSDDWDID